MNHERTEPRGGLSFAARAAALAAFGALVGPFLDFAHVSTGAVGYYHPFVFGLAWWVPIVYLSAALGIGLSHPLMDAILQRPQPLPLSPARLGSGLAGLCAVWYASGAIALPSSLVGLVLAPVCALLWWALDRTWQGLVLAAGTAIAGVLVEVVLVRLGLFYHRSTELAGVASWLPWPYVAGSFAIGNIGRRLAAGPGAVAGRPPPA